MARHTRHKTLFRRCQIVLNLARAQAPQAIAAALCCDVSTVYRTRQAYLRAGAGGAALMIGPKENALAVLEASYSYVTDTPDFFRRPYQHYPEHGNRFTGEPAYFAHVLTATRNFLELSGLTPVTFDGLSSISQM